MTTQIPDSCTFDGRQWEIEGWEGRQDWIPSNEDLGFVTTSRGTNNWSGRIDHFLVHRDQLLLFKIEVSLDPSKKGIVPFGARREVVRRYPVIERHSSDGMSLLERGIETEYFVFDDLKIPFTGQLDLTFPYWEQWNVPWPVADEDLDPKRRAKLQFVDGRLVDVIEYDLDAEEQ